MKTMKIAAWAACIFLLLSAAAFGEGFFFNESGIVFADQCPEGFQPMEEPLVLGKGETRIIAEAARYFSSDNLNVASIDENGVLRALSSGRTVISVYLADNLRKDFSLEVRNAPASIKLSNKKGTLTVGGTHQLEATLSKSSHSTIVWSSNAPHIADVDSTGKVTALSEGKCTITARTYNGLSAECAVTVKLPPPAEINLFTDEITLYPGESVAVPYTLEGGYMETVAWSSGNPGVASVDENGTVTAVNTGKTVVIMEASGGDVRFIDVIVGEGSTMVSFPAAEITLYAGGRTVFDPIIQGGSGKYEYVSMDPSIASIDKDTGEICALRAGSVYIIAITPNYAFGEFLLTVVPGPEELNLDCERTEIAIGETIYTSHNLDDFESQFTWYESTDYDVAHVNEYGVITGTGEGTAVVSVHSGGLIGQTQITVLPPAEKIEAHAERSILGAGESVGITYTLFGGAGNVEYATGDMHIAQIDGETGVIYALNPGECEITLTVSNGLTCSFPITVLPAPDSVQIEKSSYTLPENNRCLFSFWVNEGTATSFTVSSSDPELVWYDGGYLFSGNKTGSAKITVRTHNGCSAFCDVTVAEAPAQIGMNAEKLSLNPDFDYYVFLTAGSEHALSAYVDSVPDVAFEYSSSHPSVAGVSAEGIVTARAKGTSLITVSLYSGQKALVLVSVQ